MEKLRINIIGMVIGFDTSFNVLCNVTHLKEKFTYKWNLHSFSFTRSLIIGPNYADAWGLLLQFALEMRGKYNKSVQPEQEVIPMNC